MEGTATKMKMIDKTEKKDEREEIDKNSPVIPSGKERLRENRPYLVQDGQRAKPSLVSEAMSGMPQERSAGEAF